MFPRPYHVAVAIYAAAREFVPSDPGDVCLRVLEGAHGAHRFGAVKKTRIYAAIAIRNYFDGVSMTAIARMVGLNSPDTSGPEIFSNFRKGYSWWDPEIFTRICAAIRWAMVKEPITLSISMPPSSGMTHPIRPAVSERQTKALSELEKALRNTSALQGKLQ
jgi:hypothetical protein